MSVILLSKPDPKTLKGAKESIEKLWEEVQELRKNNKDLGSRVDDLKEKTKTNSRNSSKPPSSDSHRPTKKKSTTTNPSSKKKKKGAQKGHKGVGRTLEPEENADKIENCFPTDACDCGCAVDINIGDYNRKQQYEIPIIVPILTEYRLFSGKCGGCGKKHFGQLPEGIPDSILGVRAMAYASAFTGDYRVSRREVKRIFSDIFNLRVSLGSISNAENRVSLALKQPVDEAKEYVQNADILHSDETSHKKSGIKQWLWVAVTNFITAFMISSSRSSASAKELMGELFDGILVSDRYSAYTWVDKTKRQFCWAHLIRDFIKISERQGVDKEIGELVLWNIKRMFLYWYRLKNEEISRIQFQIIMKHIKETIEKLLERGIKEGKPKTQGTCKKILKFKESLWTFVHNEGVDPTNNIAERSIRAYVLWRKGSFGTQSDRGNLFVERIMTVRATCKQQNRNFLQFLIDAIHSNLTSEAPPTLLPSAFKKDQQKAA